MNYTYNQQEIDEKVIEFIYGCAMHDAILQRAFSGEKVWVGQVKEAKIVLKKYIDKVLTNKFASQEEHDAEFLDTANAICAAINEKRPLEKETDTFSFGNAQKLINIVVKHVYTFCYQNHDLREGFRFCHCPLDSIMLNEVWKRRDAWKEKVDIGDLDDFCKPWGSEGTVGDTQPRLDRFPLRYDIYQQAIRAIIGTGTMFPIEFDFVIWKA